MSMHRHGEGDSDRDRDRDRGRQIDRETDTARDRDTRASGSLLFLFFLEVIEDHLVDLPNEKKKHRLSSLSIFVCLPLVDGTTTTATTKPYLIYFFQFRSSSHKRGYRQKLRLLNCTT